MIRAKKPWAVAAASALFLGAGLLATGYAINYNAVSAKSIQDEMAKAKQMLDEWPRCSIRPPIKRNKKSSNSPIRSVASSPAKTSRRIGCF